jgi:hypothetical protein
MPDAIFDAVNIIYLRAMSKSCLLARHCIERERFALPTIERKQP